MSKFTKTINNAVVVMNAVYTVGDEEVKLRNGWTYPTHARLWRQAEYSEWKRVWRETVKNLENMVRVLRKGLLNTNNLWERSIAESAIRSFSQSLCELHMVRQAVTRQYRLDKVGGTREELVHKPKLEVVAA